ncbi:DNA polymerase domain-containing protein [Roseisolibacter sp. H3M3-2]|uniref:DNA polymerase domain-containing protein n=1 Tax=Roseisolibacter sp. H3M3-2 TaxID=3031323 RepID=UPI0023DB4A94|nr:DNA polymerase domain-containing protein [Roseisolibacter sp. H3M3-2]MDF1504867.1 DNA polymerase domain-containing protein [Roseisolibacter sp. H3M3-2]
MAPREPVGSAAADWLWGWDPTPGIVSVHAEHDGRATVWRRVPETGALVREDARFRPWLLLDALDDLRHLGDALGPEGDARTAVRHRELEGPGALRWIVSADDGRALSAALLRGASQRLGRRVGHVAELPDDAVLCLPPEEQYLVATGRTYFRDLPFDALHRLQFDLETTGLDARRDRIFMVSVRYPDGATEVLEAEGGGDAGEADLIRRLVDRVRDADPDSIENHNLHGFDLPFLDRRARALGVPLALGRIGGPGLRTRGAQRGAPGPDASDGRRVRFVAPGRELIDTLDAVRRHDFVRRDLPGHGLKAVARHLGIAAPDREYIPGDRIFATYRTDPERVRRYATDDVREVAELSRMLGGPAYALARLVPRRYERLADAGPATGMIDPTLVRAYLRAGAALPAHARGDGTPHSGAALHLFATGVATRVAKADVASLYPSLMRAYRIGPASDRLGALLALVDDLVERRLDAKARAQAAPPGSAERHTHDAMAAALKLVVNSAYGYLAAGGELTRFADVHAANEVTRRGRELLALLCRELAARDVTLLEADTDGVYFAVPEGWTEADERRVVAEVAALLPPLVKLELEGRYAAMLSHEPKNYALLAHDGELTLRGVAFRSSRSEPFGERFLREAVARLLAGDVAGVRAAYLDAVAAVRARALPTRDVSSEVRLTKSPAEYAAVRATRRELAYEALLAAGRTTWRAGERVRVYRRAGGEGGVAPADGEGAEDPRAYDADHYVRLLRTTYAERLARAFTPEDFAVVFADAEQLALFAPSLQAIRPVLRTLPSPAL